MSSTMNNGQQNISVMTQPLSHTSREMFLFMLAKCFRSQANEIKWAVILKWSWPFVAICLVYASNTSPLPYVRAACDRRTTLIRTATHFTGLIRIPAATQLQNYVDFLSQDIWQLLQSGGRNAKPWRVCVLHLAKQLILKLVVCILLLVLGQVQGFRLTQHWFEYFIQ
jgi:hypothetical protein